MRFSRDRGKANEDVFDGLTAEDVRRIRAAGAAAVTPGLEGLASHSESNSSRAGDPASATERGPIRSSDVLPRKRGRRA